MPGLPHFVCEHSLDDNIEVSSQASSLSGETFDTDEMLNAYSPRLGRMNTGKTF